MNDRISRRSFLKASAVAGGAFVAWPMAASGQGIDKNGKTSLTLPKRRIPVIMEVDVVVVGGGPAGFGAAVAAARNGAQTLLIERLGGPGGNMTSGFMCTAQPVQAGAHAELIGRLRKDGAVFDVAQKYPIVVGKPVINGSRLSNFYPDSGAFIMQEMMEEKGVKFLYRTLLTGVVTQGSTISAVLVENASGTQAIRAKAFIDATGRGDVVARAGAQFLSPGSQDDRALKLTGEPALKRPIPASLLFKMSGVDFDRWFEYLKEDPALEKKIKEARDELPKELFRPRPKDAYAAQYKGHPYPDLCPMAIPGDLLCEVSLPYEWALNTAEDGQAASRAEIELRRFMKAELNFLKSHVPGFENALISGVAPLLGMRDGRHPIGEHVITYEDMSTGARFKDAVVRRKGIDPLDTFKSGPKRTVEFDVPYRAFLAKKIDNLLLSGDCLSFSHEVKVNILKAIGWSVFTGEVAGTAAAVAVRKGITPNRLEWDRTFLPL